MLLGELIKNIKPAYKSIKFNNIRFNSKDCKTNDIFFSIQGNKLKGGSNKSYGIEAAKLAGVPKEVIEKAKSVLNSLEKNNKLNYDIE